MEIVQIFKTNPEYKKRGLSFIISVLIHAVFLCLLIHFYSPIRILTFEQEARNVFIAPPDKLYGPSKDEELQDLSDIDELFPGVRSSIESLISEPLSDLEGEKDVSFPQESPSENPVSSELSSEFRLDKVLQSETSSLEEKKINFSLESKKGDLPLEGIEKSLKGKDIDLLKYLSPEYSGEQVSPSRRSGGRSGTRNVRGRISSQQESYDLGPWAESIVNLILNNWLVPSTQKIKEKETVKIAITIQKDGKILSAKIINSSNKESLDLTVLKAIELSSPFPAMPAEFPYETLEISFVFQCHD